MSHHTDRNKGLLSSRTAQPKRKADRIPADMQKQIAEAATILYRLEKAINGKSREIIIGIYEQIYATSWWNYLPKGILNRYDRLAKQGNEILGLITK